MNWIRLATIAKSNKREGLHRNNSSGVKGVSYFKAKKRWCACIYMNNKNCHLGSYKFKDEAIMARELAEEKKKRGISFTGKEISSIINSQ